MKTLKFEAKFIPDILSGKKTSTWRLFDDKDLQEKDELTLINKETGQEFARAVILEIKMTGLDVVSDAEIKNHGYASKAEMYEAYRKYYGLKVTPTSVLKVVIFRVTEKNYICDGEKFRYGKGYVTLPVKIEGLPQTLGINGKKLAVKSSFHVSLVCAKDIVSKHGQNNQNLEQEIIKAFCDFVSKNDISFISYRDEFRYAKVDEKETMVAMCDVSNIKELFDDLNKKFGFSVETPPTHVTLYTLQPNVGIGLNNKSDIETKTTEVTDKISWHDIKSVLNILEEGKSGAVDGASDFLLN